ncbi:UNVERIFIED_CONTAM: hypothetical protein GTU68_005154 [Idotea baltica]|nr:hypothetical protein [Idotea baltica]
MRRAQDIQEAPASVAVIYSDDVQNSTADSLTELVRDVPGIQVTDSGQAGLKRIRIRGEESRRVAILIDGQAFNDEREVGTPILIAPEMIERIEILRGTSSVLHGSRGIGGVVNIITKKGGYHPLQATASTSFDSATNGFQNFLSLFGTKEGFDYRVAYSRADHDNRDSGDGEIENTEYDNNSYSLYLAREFNQHRVGLSYDDYNSSSDVYVEPEVATAPPFIDFQIDAPKRDRRKAAIFYDWDAQGDYLEKVHADFYYQVSEREFNTFSELQLDIGQGPFIRNSNVLNSSTLDTFGASLLTEFSVADHTLLAGADLKTDSLDQNRRRELTENGQRVPDELVFDEATQDSVEVFLQDEWSFLEKWALIAGSRAYWFRNELEETTREGLSPSSSTDLSAVASLGFKHTPDPKTTFWANWSQGYVVPTLINTAVGAFAGPDYVSPNQDLDPETSNSVDLGVRHASDKLSVELSLFAVKARNYIEHVRCNSTEVSCIEPSVGRRDRVYVNIDEATSFGAEFSTSYEFQPYLTPYLNAAWLRRRFKTEDVSTYDTGLPTISARSGLRTKHRLTPWALAWADMYLRTATDSKEIDGNELERSSGWGTLNLSLGTTLGRKQQFRVIVDILNIGDNSYEAAVENIPARGRSASIKLVADL